MVQAPPVQNGGGVERKVLELHSMDNKDLDFLKGISQRGFLQLRGSQYQKKRYAVGRQYFGAMIVRPMYVLRAASRLTTQS
jgi:hypothetical protein